MLGMYNLPMIVQVNVENFTPQYGELYAPVNLNLQGIPEATYGILMRFTQPMKGNLTECFLRNVILCDFDIINGAMFPFVRSCMVYA